MGDCASQPFHSPCIVVVRRSAPVSTVTCSGRPTSSDGDYGWGSGWVWKPGPHGGGGPGGIGPPPPGGGWAYSGKGGKSGDYYGYGSSKGGKSGSSSSMDDDDDHSHGHMHWVYGHKPWDRSSSSSSDGSSPDWYTYYHTHSHSHHDDSTSPEDDDYDYDYEAPPPLDSSAPGVCAPSHSLGGLDCSAVSVTASDGNWNFCTSVGHPAECGSKQTCYPKELCPAFVVTDGSDHHGHRPAGVCGLFFAGEEEESGHDGHGHGHGLDCKEVETYCTEPGGGHAECGPNRMCHDAALCGLGDDPWGWTDYDGVCGPDHDEGGLDCGEVGDVGERTMCTEPGGRAECGGGRTCYPKELCPASFGGGGDSWDPVGVCGVEGGGLECSQSTAYCTEPGSHAECGSGRLCHDAALCGFGDEDDVEEVPGVCGSSSSFGGLDCTAVTTGCTAPGEGAECAFGSLCFDAGLCDVGGGGWDDDRYAGFCGTKGGGGGDDNDCDDFSTSCARPGEGGQCPSGKECIDRRVCSPTLPPVATPAPTTPSRPAPLLEACFVEGTVVDCVAWLSDGWGGDEWGDDGHVDKDDDAWLGDGNGDKGDNDDDEQDDDGDDDADDYEDKGAWLGDGHHGGGIITRFTYTVDTDGEVDPDDVIRPLENAIFEDVKEYVEDNEDYGSFTGRITARPKDYIAGDEYCGDGNTIRCSVVKGAMGFYVHDSNEVTDGYSIDNCTAAGIIRDSMEGNDYTEVDGVTNAEYRNSDDVDCGKIISGAATVIMPPTDDDSIGAAAAFGILAACAALVALAFLAVRRRGRRKPGEDDDYNEKDVTMDSEGGEMDRRKMPLIYNDLGGDFSGAPTCSEDPYANTIDVHKCTSLSCDICNKGGSELSFLPVPGKMDMAKTMMANGISPTGVDDAESFFGEDPYVTDEPELESTAATKEAAEYSADRRGSIMRVPIRSQIQHDGERALTPVNEVPHDSEIDTEMESLAGVMSYDGTDAGTHNDETTVPPPPPPLSFHPAYRPDSGDVPTMDSNDEMSI